MSEPKYRLEDCFGELPDVVFTNSGKASVHAKAAAAMQDRVITIHGNNGKVWDVYPDGLVERRYRSRES